MLASFIVHNYGGGGGFETRTFGLPCVPDLTGRADMNKRTGLTNSRCSPRALLTCGQSESHSITSGGLPIRRLPTPAQNSFSDPSTDTQPYSVSRSRSLLDHDTDGWDVIFADYGPSSAASHASSDLPNRQRVVAVRSSHSHLILDTNSAGRWPGFLPSSSAAVRLGYLSLCV